MLVTLAVYFRFPVAFSYCSKLKCKGKESRWQNHYVYVPITYIQYLMKSCISLICSNNEPKSMRHPLNTTNLYWFLLTWHRPRDIHTYIEKHLVSVFTATKSYSASRSVLKPLRILPIEQFAIARMGLYQTMSFFIRFTPKQPVSKRQAGLSATSTCLE